MIYGLTTREQAVKDKNDSVNEFFTRRMGIKKFAYLPVEMFDGRMLKGEHYYKAIPSYRNPKDYSNNVFPDTENIYYAGQSVNGWANDIKESHRQDYVVKNGAKLCGWELDEIKTNNKKIDKMREK
tara:strand:- start:2232 stop:2609 length:378 start_codon:yes stop_codon:yes gene_type:complete